ncbi:MAG: tetratricopeptide repeat protein [Rhodoferax sp.]|nr:tetratricopeptide repeat protein [Rhodoferax sp.]
MSRSHPLSDRPHPSPLAPAPLPQPLVNVLQQALAQHQQGQLAEAMALYQQVLAHQPRHFDALHMLGVAHIQAGQCAQAEALIAQALEIAPDNTLALCHRGVALTDLQRWDQALQCYDRAIALEPSHAQALSNRSIVLQSLGWLDEALRSVDQALALQPNFPEAHLNRGNVLRDQRRLEASVQSLEQALALRPHYPEAYMNRGLALKDLKRLEQALLSLDQAIAQKPGYANAYNCRAATLQDMGRVAEAVQNYAQAIKLQPHDAKVHSNRGVALQELRHMDAALDSFQQAFALEPDHPYLLGQMLHTQMNLCDWTGWEQRMALLESGLLAGQKVSNPFPLVALLDAPALQLGAARTYAQSQFPANALLGPCLPHQAEGKIRIGYYSRDFHNHAAAHLVADLLEAHDTGRFELHGFSFGPDRQDAMRQRLQQAFGHFHDVQRLSDVAVARHSRDLGLDIAVDLMGFTQNSRTGIFAARCAPVQVNFLGYPGTLGAVYIDYIIADKTVIPPHSLPDYAEKVAWLGHGFHVNDAGRQPSGRLFTRQDFGLPDGAFVFCCFNKCYKILPATWAGWMRILQAVPGSVLWLFEGNPTARANLCRAAQAQGINPVRLVFAQSLPALEDHLARNRLADLFLDTLPYNAHTTASDALCVGLPVLTLCGQTFASRVAASLLTTLQLPQLITHSQADYEARAIALASQPAELARLRTALQQQRRNSALFDRARFARDMESLFLRMVERSRAGLAPQHLLEP